jgi:hypothetical protein
MQLSPVRGDAQVLLWNGVVISWVLARVSEWYIGGVIG